MWGFYSSEELRSERRHKPSTAIWAVIDLGIAGISYVQSPVPLGRVLNAVACGAVLFLVSLFERGRQWRWFPVVAGLIVLAWASIAEVPNPSGRPVSDSLVFFVATAAGVGCAAVAIYRRFQKPTFDEAEDKKDTHPNR